LITDHEDYLNIAELPSAALPVTFTALAALACSPSSSFAIDSLCCVSGFSAHLYNEHEHTTWDDMAARKRAHDQMTPDSHSPSSSGSNALDSMINDVHEPVAKKFKPAEVVSSPVIQTIDLVLSSVVVEPCVALNGSESSATSPFIPIPGRESEFKLIEDHYARCLDRQQPQPLFICGAPGCGKTASISKIISSNSRLPADNWTRSMLAPYTARVNCATDLVGSKPSALYSLLYDRLVESFDASSISSALNLKLQGMRPPHSSDQELLPFLLKRINQHHIEYSKQRENKKPYFIMVLIDEIDHVLLSKGGLNAELHFLFSSWLESWGIISIVAISNDRDLFDRNLPLLADLSGSTIAGGSQSKKAGVLTVPFKPYTSEQLESILRTRISQPQLECGKEPVTLEAIFDPKTLKFICGKIAKIAGDQAGDVRVLIDLCKAMLLEARTSNKLPITIDVAAKTWKLKMGPPPSDPISQLSRSQKCALLCMLHASIRSEIVRPPELDTNWKMNAARLFPSAPDLSELWSSIALLESTGNVRIQKEKGNRVTYKLVSKDQIRDSLSKDPLFKDLLP